MTFQRDHISIRGTAVAILTAGSGDPLVIFHGAGTSTGFESALPLAERYRVIVPYHPGWGESGDDLSLTSLHDYVLHYLDLFDAMGVSKIRLIGFSMGGWLASKFATEHSHRLHKMVLVAPAGLDVPEHPMFDFSNSTQEQIMSSLTVDPSILVRTTPMPPPAEWLALRAREGGNFGRMLASGYPDLALRRWLHRVSVPTLIQWGSADAILPAEQMAAWQSLIPGSTTRLYEGSGHLLFDERADAVNDAGEFLA